MDAGETVGRGAVGLALGAATAMVVGLLWDVSWDASFGKDSFWSPPHVALNFGAMALVAVAALAAAAATASSQATRLRLGMLRVPFGFGLALWGGLAMLGWAILDTWWSSAYGLYADLWSPPQVLFSLSLAALLCGTGLAAASLANRRSDGSSFAVAWVAGLLIAIAALTTAQYNLPNVQRTATFLLSACIVYPPILAWAAAFRPGRWSATLTAGSYMLLIGTLVWLFPLFPAEPLIGPIYEPVDHLLPPRFPLLLVAPALLVDVVVDGKRSVLLSALACGVGFVAVFAAVQWYFSGFLLAPASDNWFFAGGGQHWPFYMEIGPERALHWGVRQDPMTASAVALGAGFAAVGSGLGVLAGRWARELRG